MAESLPLIPEKENAVCADVRSVLREVFRELDFLPPLAAKVPTIHAAAVGDHEHVTHLPKVEPWMDKYNTECKEIWRREGELKNQHARRIAREPLPNIYKLYPPKQKLPKAPSWKNERGIIQRRDLMPSIEQNAGRDESLWVQNTLHQSSGELASVEVRGSTMRLPLTLASPRDSNFQSVSIGEVVSRSAAALPPAPPASAPPASAPPDHIMCVPPQLDFVNFTVGNLQTKSVRLVNVSKFECRLSIRPPGRRELDVELCAARGLTLTSGAHAQLKVHFRPRDVRVLRDVIFVRVSTGGSLVVPISCYMQPPLLDILVPAMPSSIFSCSPVEKAAAGARGTRGNEILELGARLLGDVHYVKALTAHGSAVADPFVVSPAWWAGGGAVRARVWCRARAAGLHTAALRVLASTAVVRPLHLLADSLYFRPYHVTIEAHSKDYDICSTDDPACEYFVHLGTAFPRRALSASVQLVNHSPVTYSYYWSVRAWGVCSCREEEQASRGSLAPEHGSGHPCVGARVTRDMELDGTVATSPSKCETARMVRVEPMSGLVTARASASLHVCAPDTGHAFGTQRAVLMLILKDIPKESFPKDFDPMIVKTEIVNSKPITGVKGWSREVCEVVCAQMEVWWEVVPVRFVLDPPVLPLVHSRRVSSVDVCVRATQLYGCEGLRGRWSVPAAMPLPSFAKMTSAQSCAIAVRCPLPALPDEHPELDIITLKSEEWEAACSVRRQCATRHPALQPARVWLGVVPPAARLTTSLKIINDTHQNICWWSTPHRWMGENRASRACAGRAPCASCRERRCTCAPLRPARGALGPDVSTTVHYDVHAPDTDGCVCTLVATRRTSADVCRVSGLQARAALLVYRVLAPRLALRVLPCDTLLGDTQRDCENCRLDEGRLQSARGTATLRPRAALTLSHLSRYRLRVSNITPIPTTVTWDPPLEEDVLNVVIIPKELEVKSYGEVDFQVVLDARKVCGRRVFVYRARVKHAYKPIYLIIDAAIAGIEIVCEVPIGEELTTDSTLILRRTQREEFPRYADKPKPSSPEEMFQDEDRKRALRAENICYCHLELVYIPPVKRPRPPPQGPDDYPPVDIVWSPPRLTRVCPCFGVGGAKPTLTDHDRPFCLQFKQLPLGTVMSRVVRIRNESVVAGSWSATVRRCGRTHAHTLLADAWAGDVRAPGLAMQCTPRSGVLAARATILLTVQVYADCWGLYHDQLLIKIDNVEAIVLDVWVEATGAPLLFAINLADVDTDTGAAPLLLWISASDPERTLRVKNRSRSELTVHSYMLTENGYHQDVLPFRLYLRLFDVLPRSCPCNSAFQSESAFGEESDSKTASSYEEEMDTAIEIFLAADYGRQEQSFFKISPDTRTVSPGSWAVWTLSLQVPPHHEVAPPTTLLLRPLPVLNCGEGWYRPDPLPQTVKLRQTVREGHLKVSRNGLHVKLCALDFPFEDVLRVRKRFRVQNVGCGPLEYTTRCKAPWSIVVDDESRLKGGVGCVCGSEGERHRECRVPMYLLPRSSMEMCVEVRVSTAESWPAAPALPCQPHTYERWRRTVTELRFYDTDNVLLSLPMHLEIEYPVVRMEPAVIDFGFVTDGDTRKSYFTVSHSSRTVSIDMVTEWAGGEQFRLWPRDFTLQPGGRERVYVQYTARWSGAPAEGCVVCSAARGARLWCRGVARARAEPARDAGADRRTHAQDHTDDTHLPPVYSPLPLHLPLPTDH